MLVEGIPIDEAMTPEMFGCSNMDVHEITATSTSTAIAARGLISPQTKMVLMYGKDATETKEVLRLATLRANSDNASLGTVQTVDGSRVQMTNGISSQSGNEYISLSSNTNTNKFVSGHKYTLVVLY